MKTVINQLRQAGEVYAAALLENPERSPLWRYSRATAEFFKIATLPRYDGGRLYPCGHSFSISSPQAVKPEFSYTWSLETEKLRQRVPEAVAPLQAEKARVAPINTPHTIGGAGYTHSFINFRRILADGLDGYRARVAALPAGDFRAAMEMLLEGIEVLRQRCVAHLREAKAPVELIAALEWVPNRSPRNIYEALVAWNFVYYVDGCDDLGGLDRGLLPYWKGEDVTELLRELYRHVDDNNGWSMPLGPRYNGLTLQCIRASHYSRRPSIQLLVTRDMPDEVWQEAYASLATSCGQPAFYNWDSYKREIGVRLPQVTEEDLYYLAFGGCTETMIEGLSNVGSDDAGLHTALIFDDFFRNHLGDYETFDAFMDGYATEAEKAIDEVCAILENHRRTRAIHRPHPIRTLLVDDCIDRQTDFNAGGARYNWSVINVAGLINVIDSLAVIEKLVFEERRYTPEQFIRLLDARDPRFLAACEACPKHGNDDPAVNRIAEAVSARIYGRFETHTCTPGGRYFPVSNQFTTCENAGHAVRATPDGRAAGDPLCDSCGAIRGRDVSGPTAMLNSVASLRLAKALGTPITNLRMKKESLPTLLKPLVQGFFRQGGVQLQITCASRAELLDAVAHPKKHENLVVRIGGYSEYFNRLSPVLKQTVIERTEY
ncbi:MAG: hypothetical protein GX174_12830 [Lentisphaerae bacterium]|nr:hypothetical protein [Lentisphaerota bacterium]